MVENGIHVDDDAMILCYLYGVDKLFLRTPFRTASDFLVEFAQVKEIINIISNGFLRRRFRWSLRRMADEFRA